MNKTHTPKLSSNRHIDKFPPTDNGPLFPEKLKKANEILAESPLPKELLRKL